MSLFDALYSSLIMNSLQLRVLCVGTDRSLLNTRQALLASRGYACSSALPHEVPRYLAEERFDIVILSVALGREEQEHIRTKLPTGTRVLVLTHLVSPDELFDLVAKAASAPVDTQV
jgi:DNA-binding response OmpR family regulator